MTNVPTSREVWLKGDWVDDWACDINPYTGEMESNGAVEHKIEYKGRYYSVITDWGRNFIRRANKPASLLQ